MRDIWGYRFSYYLTHPLTAIREPWGVLVAFFQRGRRGWAVSDTWNMDYYLAGVIADMLAHLAAHNHGCPAYFEGKDANFAAWDAWLKDQALAYHEYVNFMNDPDRWQVDIGNIEYSKMIERMRILFDHYGSLGD